MQYKYIASQKTTGEKITGVITAPSIPDVVMQLKVDGLLPLKVFEAKKVKKEARRAFSFLSHRVKGKELAIFTRQIAATLSAGLLLTESLETIADDLENEYFRKIIRAIREDIISGSDFSSALSKYPKIFPVTYVAIVRSGETTGNLHTTMSNLAKYLESTERLKEKVKSAVRYPAFVVGFAFIVVAVIVLFLIPKFQTMFDNAGAELPLLTRIVVGISDFCLHNVHFLALGMVVSFILYIYCLKFYKFRRIIDALKFKIPILGKEIIHKSCVSRFCRTLGFLFAGGIGLAKALEISSQVVDHSLMSEAINRIKTRVVSGASIADEIKKQDIFPSLTTKMVAVGERTGKISEMLTRTSDYYDEELETSLQNLTALLEPALIIFVGAIVLVVVLALYLPIFNMSSAIN